MGINRFCVNWFGHEKGLQIQLFAINLGIWIL